MSRARASPSIDALVQLIDWHPIGPRAPMCGIYHDIRIAAYQLGSHHDAVDHRSLVRVGRPAGGGVRPRPRHRRALLRLDPIDLKHKFWSDAPELLSKSAGGSAGI